VVGFFSPVEDNYAKLTSAPRILVNRPLALQLNRGNLMVSYAGRAPLAQLAPITQNLAQALPNASVLSRALETDARARVYDTLALFATSVAGLAFVAGAVLIANATSLALLERRREIGILKAVGYSSRKVLQTILLENSLLGVIAGVCGLVSIVIVVAIINVWQPAAKIGLNPPLMLIMAAVAILLALGSAAAVAWQPTQVRPLTVLRTE